MSKKPQSPICRSFRQDFPQFVARAEALGVNISLSEGRRNGRERVFWLDGYKQVDQATRRNSDGSPVHAGRRCAEHRHRFDRHRGRSRSRRHLSVPQRFLRVHDRGPSSSNKPPTSQARNPQARRIQESEDNCSTTSKNAKPSWTSLQKEKRTNDKNVGRTKRGTQNAGAHARPKHHPTARRRQNLQSIYYFCSRDKPTRKEEPSTNDPQNEEKIEMLEKAIKQATDLLIQSSKTDDPAVDWAAKTTALGVLLKATEEKKH
jgi:hypothetical protein